jgi:hypothetical protein
LKAKLKLVKDPTVLVPIVTLCFIAIGVTHGLIWAWRNRDGSQKRR